jgi:predicted 2-oxoglutarate/Fe(II)-dependent dioxygenase YbiX
VHHEQSAGTHPMMHSESMPEVWEILTEEQKKKVMLMKMDMKIQWMEAKINEMEKMIELKKKAIDHVRMVQEMIKQGK